MHFCLVLYDYTYASGRRFTVRATGSPPIDTHDQFWALSQNQLKTTGLVYCQMGTMVQHHRKHCNYFSIIRVTHVLLLLICFRFLICILQMQETILRLAAGSLAVRLDQRKAIFRACCLLLAIVGAQWRVMWLQDEFSFTSVSSALSVLSLDSAAAVWNTTKRLGVNITILTVLLAYVLIITSLDLNSSQVAVHSSILRLKEKFTSVHSLSIHPYIYPNLCNFLSSEEYKRRISKYVLVDLFHAKLLIKVDQLKISQIHK